MRFKRSECVSGHLDGYGPTENVLSLIDVKVPCSLYRVVAGDAGLRATISLVPREVTTKEWRIHGYEQRSFGSDPQL